MGLHVAVYAPGLFPESGGGYTFEKDVLDQLNLLSGESKHRFTLISIDSVQNRYLTENFPLVRHFDASSFQFRLFYYLNKTKAMTRKSRKSGFLQSALNKIRADVVWFVTPQSQPVDTPYIATIWDLQHRKQPWFPEVGVMQEWLSREYYYNNLIRRAAYVIAGNQAGRNEIVNFYQIPAERIRLLPHPAPAWDGKFTPIGNLMGKYSIPERFLLYPAQFWAHKNHANILLSLKIIKDKYNVEIPMVFVGSDKGNIHYIRKLAVNIGIDKNVYFLGFVPREDLMGLYKSAIALTYLSYFGPENLPPLEAFSLGCPVLASKVDGSMEQLGSAAILVDPKNKEEIAAGIYKLFSDESLRSQCINAGYLRAKTWTSSDFVKGLFGILDEFYSIRICWPLNSNNG